MVGGKVGGDIVQGVGAYEAGRYNKKSLYASATASEQDGADEGARIREAARAAIGEQIAAQGESGFQQGTGSALDALSQSQVNATLDVLNARRQAAARARQQRVQGDIAMATGKNQLVSSLIQAGNDAASAVAGVSGGGGSAPAVPAYQGVDWGGGAPPSTLSGYVPRSTLSGYNGGYRAG